MRLPFRILAMLIIIPTTYYFIYWISSSFLPFTEHSWIPVLLSFMCAFGVGKYSWEKLGTLPEGPISSIFLGAIALGSISFCAGFFGPMIITPEADQGPLLGIFITGPVGFLIGGISGFIYWLTKEKKETRK
ncbi:hypothetical protein [Nitrosomonas communis]|uniref:Uncharacterized protein n=1 Tax=Nitrosomonas communis TaxID=44574 RepID=A0A1I4QEY9_9PROT|nr:hypothetical protein [Nitrosomonas communis]SFM38639.1 hypothetical protein SAMN05421863_102636 [Nitrosomonas communis]